MSPPLEHRARLRECPELVRLIVAKFLEHDGRYQAGGWWWRARRGAEVFAGVWGEMLSSNVWTDEDHDAVVCETPERRKWWPVAPVAGCAALGPFVAMLPGPVQGVPAVMAVVGFISLVPTLRRELRRSKRHRPNAGVLTFLASRRPGAGRALLDARCAAADGRGAWLCPSPRRPLSTGTPNLASPLLAIRSSNRGASSSRWSGSRGSGTSCPRIAEPPQVHPGGPPASRTGVKQPTGASRSHEIRVRRGKGAGVLSSHHTRSPVVVGTCVRYGPRRRPDDERGA